MTAAAGKVVSDGFPGVTYVLIMSDGQTECVTGNVPETGEALGMLMSAFEQLVKERQAMSAKVGQA